MPRVGPIRPVGRWQYGWQPAEKPRKGFYLCACGFFHDDNGDVPRTRLPEK